MEMEHTQVEIEFNRGHYCSGLPFIRIGKGIEG